MSNSVQVIDELLTKFDKEIAIISTIPDKNTNLVIKSNINPSSISTITNINPTEATCNKIQTTTSSAAAPISNRQKEEEEETKSETKEELKEDLNGSDLDELSEEEALRLAMAMSMTSEDRKLVSCINKEISEAQQLLSNWFSGNFKSIKDKNKAWFDFSRRLHHQFEMYRIEQDIIQPLSYQFFIQFIALMYNSMPKTIGNNKGKGKKNKRKNKRKNNKQNDKNNTLNDETLYIDQHKVRNIQILSADDDAIKYLRFAQGIQRNELRDAVYAKFESLALDPMNPNQWKFNHVMFLRSNKAPNGLLWTKWHMQ